MLCSSSSFPQLIGVHAIPIHELGISVCCAICCNTLLWKDIAALWCAVVAVLCSSSIIPHPSGVRAIPLDEVCIGVRSAICCNAPIWQRHGCWVKVWGVESGTS